MAFDIASVLKNVPDPAAEQIELIELDRIDPDPDNFYSLDGLEDLAANIELIGLQQPLRVRPGADGHVIVVSGHRRRAACMILRDAGNEKFRKLPCIREQGEESPAMRELRLIYANASTRVMRPEEISRQAERVEALLYQLKEEGVKFPGRMRDHVAEACRVSKSKLARLHAIRTNLIPPMLARFDRGEIPEETSYQLSRLPSMAQHAAEQCLLTGRKKALPYAYQVERVVKDLETYTKPAACSAHAGCPDCNITHVHICRSLWEPYRDCNNLTPNKGKNGICCRVCNDRASCSWACQECKDRRKLDDAVAKEKAAEQAKQEAARREAEQRKYRKRRQEQAKRVLALAEELGLSDDVELPGQFYWSPGLQIKAVRKAARGDFGDQTFYEASADLIPINNTNLKAWAEALHCSTDYLLGLSDEPHPERGKVSEADTSTAWGTGDPTEMGEYVVKAGAHAAEKTGGFIWTVMTWSGLHWDNKNGVPSLLTVYRWLKLPED